MMRRRNQVSPTRAAVPTRIAPQALAVFMLSFVGFTATLPVHSQHTGAPSQGEARGESQSSMKHTSVDSCSTAMASAFAKLNAAAARISQHVSDETRARFGRFSSGDTKDSLLELADNIKRLNSYQPPYTFGFSKSEVAKEALTKTYHYKDFDNVSNARKLCDGQTRKLSPRSDSLFQWGPAHVKKDVLSRLNELNFPSFPKETPPAGLQKYVESEIGSLKKIFEAL